MDYPIGFQNMKPYRAVFHVHSTWSYDGSWKLSEIAALYEKFGVDLVLMTEHDTGFVPESFGDYRAECKAASTKTCQLIPGIEYSSPDNDVHILTWGLDEFLGEHRPVIQTLNSVRDGNGVAVFAHPVRRNAWKAFDPDWAPFLSGIELWNRKTDGVNWSPEAWSLIRDTGLSATVGQDFHRARQLYPLTMKLNLAEDGLLEERVVDAIRIGAFEPRALGSPLLDANGTPRKYVHGILEACRRSVVRLVRSGKR